MRAVVVNGARSAGDVRAEDGAEAWAFHTGLDGFAPTPVRELEPGRVWMKDESSRFGLPAFKVLGASWAVQRALREGDGASVHTLVAASAGNHGRAVAWAARRRGLACRVYLPARSVAARREAIAGEGAEVVAIDGTYEDAVALAERAGEEEGVLEIADVGLSGPARWVVDGYATLFAELGGEGGNAYDLIVVPVGVGSLGAAAARFGAAHGIPVIAAEPATAACLAASLEAGEPVAVPTPGTTMAGLDCAEVSAHAWPDLLAGIAGVVTVTDAEVHAAMRSLAARGWAIGDSGAAPLAALRALREDPACAALREAVGFDAAASRVLLVATEGVTDPEGYAAVVG